MSENTSNGFGDGRRNITPHSNSDTSASLEARSGRQSLLPWQNRNVRQSRRGEYRNIAGRSQRWSAGLVSLPGLQPSLSRSNSSSTAVHQLAAMPPTNAPQNIALAILPQLQYTSQPSTMGTTRTVPSGAFSPPGMYNDSQQQSRQTGGLAPSGVIQSSVMPYATAPQHAPHFLPEFREYNPFARVSQGSHTFISPLHESNLFNPTVQLPNTYVPPNLPFEYPNTFASLSRHSHLRPSGSSSTYEAMDDRTPGSDLSHLSSIAPDIISSSENLLFYPSLSNFGMTTVESNVTPHYTPAVSHRDVPGLSIPPESPPCSPRDTSAGSEGHSYMSARSNAFPSSRAHGYTGFTGMGAVYGSYESSPCYVHYN
jgi:hypothetical protein